MTTVLPAPVLYGTVVGQFWVTAPDTGDADDLPDKVAVEGSVTFTPMVKAILAPTAAPPFTMLPTPDTVTLVNGAFSRKLIATDSPNLNPIDWQWAVSFNFTNAPKYDSFAFTLHHDSSLDLSVAAPVPITGGRVVVPAGLGNVIYQHGAPTDPLDYPLGVFVVDIDDNFHVYEIADV